MLIPKQKNESPVGFLFSPMHAGVISVTQKRETELNEQSRPQRRQTLGMPDQDYVK